MNMQEEKIKQLFADGILTKEEMEAELKKINNKKTARTSTNKRLWVYIVVVLAIVIAVITVLKNHDDEPTNQNYDTENLFGPEGGSVDDRMTIDGKHLFKFYLGEFKDIDGYSDYAKKALGRSIEFYICPSKDASRVSYIEIKPAFSSGLAVTRDNTENREWRFVGPCIYDRGRKWYNPWGNGMITSDWSPTSTMHRVRLTPEAEIEASKLLRLISFGKISESDGDFYVKERKLTKQEIKDMLKFGILFKKNWFSKIEIAEGYNRAIENK